MFRGRYQHTIDPKGRLSVPAKFRDALAQSDGALVIVPNEDIGGWHWIEVHPLEEWQRLEAWLRAQPLFSAAAHEVGVRYFSRAKDVTLDTAGRILIPPDAREQAGLAKKEVTLVGGGLPRFEVWDRGRFEEYERTRQERLPSLFERLSSQGV
jgi:MraZ protein